MALPPHCRLKPYRLTERYPLPPNAAVVNDPLFPGEDTIQKAKIVAFWKQKLEKAKVEAGRIWAEKGKGKGRWASWAQHQLAGLESAQYQSMVKREGSGWIRAETEYSAQSGVSSSNRIECCRPFSGIGSSDIFMQWRP